MESNLSSQHKQIPGDLAHGDLSVHYIFCIEASMYCNIIRYTLNVRIGSQTLHTSRTSIWLCSAVFPHIQFLLCQLHAIFHVILLKWISLDSISSATLFYTSIFWISFTLAWLTDPVDSSSWMLSQFGSEHAASRLQPSLSRALWCGMNDLNKINLWKTLFLVFPF